MPVASPPRDADGRVVDEGDTLWRIASANTQGASVAQMMLAIQRANPDAFIRENINLLRKGAVLRIPTGEQAQALANTDANAQVREQMNAWRASTAAAPQPVPTPDEAPRLAAPASPSAPARTSATAATASRPAASGGRLEIAPPAGAGAVGAQSGAASGGSGSELRAELQQAREDVSARDAELRELRSRLTEQEALANEQKRLIELKDSQLSALEESLRQNRETAATAQPAAAEQPAASPTEAPALAESAASAPPAATPETSPTAAVEPGADASTAVADASAAPSASEPWYMNTAVLGGGGVVLVGGLLALLLRRRKASAVALPAVAAAPSRSRLSDDSEFLSNLSPNTNDSDAEASQELADEAAHDVPPARGDEAVTAERPVAGLLMAELERSVAASPADLDQHVTLLRQLYNAGNVDAFVAAATTMRANVAENADPRWREVVVMGMGLVPGHALFREVLWNPVKSDDVRTRKDASAPTPAPVAAPVPASMPEPEPSMGNAEALDDTRLELAKAYIEIGDTDGARGMLEEVLAEGNAAARAEAERLLKQIG
jgi:pilus assembly protein FimV